MSAFGLLNADIWMGGGGGEYERSRQEKGAGRGGGAVRRESQSVADVENIDNLVIVMRHRD